jgi:hypothetical protein
MEKQKSTKKVTENAFTEMIDENIPSLKEHVDIQIQDVQMNFL